MHRFRLLGFYVAGIVWWSADHRRVSMRRTADDHGTREAPAEETVAPNNANTESISVSSNNLVCSQRN